MPVIRPTRLDALLAVAVFCLVAAAAAAGTTPLGRAIPAYGFAAGFAVLALAGRAWPVPALLATALGLVAYYLLDLPPVGLAGPIAATLYLAAEQGRLLPASLVGGGLLAASVAARLAEGDDVAVVVGAELGSEAALMLAVIALGDAVRSRRSLRRELDRRTVAAAEERRREAVRLVEAERVRIAREVHDTLGHTMSVITLQSAVAQEALVDGASARAETALSAIRSAGTAAMSELRATLRTLRHESGDREPAPGVDQVPALTERIARSGLPVDLAVRGPTDALPAVAGTTAYRLIQEALTNALRHAGATRVEVRVEVTPARLELEVTDDGRGTTTDLADAPGHGLRGMAERVTLLGGVLTAGNATGGGFRVHAELPLAGDQR